MKIVALEPFLAELAVSFDLTADIVGVSHRSTYPEKLKECRVVTRDPKGTPVTLSHDEVLLTEIKTVTPDIILTRFPDKVGGELFDEKKYDLQEQKRREMEEVLQEDFNYGIKLKVYNPRTLEGVYQMYQQLAKDLAVPAMGIKIYNLVKAQIQCWTSSFYERVHNKRVTILSSIAPLKLAALWIPDIIRLTSAISQAETTGRGNYEVEWSDILSFRPDVIIIAPEGMNVEDSARSFKVLEEFPYWEDIPAVKRGEVYFTNGTTFYTPSYRILNAAGIIISAIAGLESGYITSRNDFYKLRWLELQRHKF
ncbi:MAG: ABC transporter substrate-binding protein [Bdellovibrionota bacterium]|jgi:ABC-type Fe3+-hydroxamate transport system substrate-binding protein